MNNSSGSIADFIEVSLTGATSWILPPTLLTDCNERWGWREGTIGASLRLEIACNGDCEGILPRLILLSLIMILSNDGGPES
jgi:hypothetical protein